MWNVGAYFCKPAGEVDHENGLNQRIERIKDCVRDLNRQIMYQDTVVKQHAKRGLSYLDTGDEQMARSEAQMQLQAVETRQSLVDIFTKFRMLLNEIERTQSLSICVQNFSQASGVLKDIPLSVQNVDEMMVRFEQQMERARDVQKAVARPLGNLRQVFLQTELPELPKNLTRPQQQETDIGPSVTLEL